MDEKKAIRRAVDTGKVVFGSNKTIQEIKTGDLKMVVVASNCPKDIKERIEHYSKLSNVPVYDFKGTGVELGSTCGKPFSVAVLNIMDEGNSQVLDLLGEDIEA
ncbi:MAG: 50S ribosomal protein L30e [Candidatus Diapherotrites archaeon]|nr:50S ribosomal protein L30e [Candidatus Diapherotrites archaeon]